MNDDLNVPSEEGRHGAPLVLVTGATGYVGGRLVTRLLDCGYLVRVLVRDAANMSGRPWTDQVEVAEGDVLKPESLARAMVGVQYAYYMVHSMAGSSNFVEKDREAARNFGRAARAAGVERIIYLGGLGDPESDLSRHLRSRQQTGETLRESGVPVTEFRAAIIAGSGSVSFEMIRYLTERLPVMICPRWVYTRVQPIAVRDILSYLVSAPRLPESAGKVLEIGGPDILTYGEMMTGYARARGMRRLLLPVPVLTPTLSSYWVHFITPIPDKIARPLIEGLRNETVVRDNLAHLLFPEIEPMDHPSALRLALSRVDAGQVATSWSNALVTSQGDVPPVKLTNREGLIMEERQAVVPCPPWALYRTFSGLGGDRGWLYADLAWTIRGLMDRAVGGVGLRRGRRHPDEVYVGEALDFWRVEAAMPNRLFRLRAEMRLPGKPWLQFETAPQPNGTTRLVQTAFFAPRGLSELAYWYLLYPIHSLIFSGLIREIARRAAILADAAFEETAGR
ncbi:MAG TPA: DUF2867 domain-containing protein [Chloroflexota bacterium]|nr:DUF2867 domain-containing protein [Chloroflexota bacterium]